MSSCGHVLLILQGIIKVHDLSGAETKDFKDIPTNRCQDSSERGASDLNGRSPGWNWANIANFVRFWKTR